jgi:hypothetical protein
MLAFILVLGMQTWEQIKNAASRTVMLAHYKDMEMQMCK